MRNKIGDKARLLHIRDAILEIESYIKGKKFEDFASNSMMKSAVIKQLETIGEASSKLSTLLKESNTDVDWKAIVAMRNILVHEYFAVSIDIIWKMITNDLPGLRVQMERILPGH